MAKIIIGSRNPQKKLMQVKRALKRAEKSIAEMNTKRISRMIKSIDGEATRKRVELIKKLQNREISKEQYQKASRRIDAWVSMKYKQLVSKIPEVMKQTEVEQLDALKRISQVYRQRRNWIKQNIKHNQK